MKKKFYLTNTLMLSVYRQVFTLILCSLISMLVSCAPKRNLVYFNDLPKDGSVTQNFKIFEPTIQTDDILSITVNTLNPESNQLFNIGNLSMQNVSSANNNPITHNNADGYLVDKNGQINFPVIGKIDLAGLTLTEANELLVQKISKSVKAPIVNTHFTNFRITVIGEVNKPGTFTLPDKKVSLLQALGMAGDLTAFGRRENILLIREQNGKKEMVRFNLAKKETLSSPFFYLQQNDVVYVEPDSLKESQTNNNFKYATIAVSIISVVVIVLTRIL